MAITYGKIKDDSLKLVDEYSSRGVSQSLTKTADYNFKIQSLVNACIYDLASTTAKIPAVFSIVHNPIKNTLADDTSAIRTYTPGTDYSITLTNAQATFFEATYPGQIIIEESFDNGVSYTVIETINVPSTETAFAEYRRLIVPTLSTNLVRLRFAGNYRYSFRNYVLYEYGFPAEDDVQQHRPIFSVDLPTNYLDIDTVFAIKNGQKLPYSNFNIDSEQFFFSSYEDPMELQVEYWRKPTLLTFTQVDATDRALTIDLADEAALIIPWNVAGEVLKSEKDLAGGVLAINQFEVKKGNLAINKTSRIGLGKSVYGW